ncbi:MAG: hypothetical protein ACNYPI_05475 [Arenicellales bacterium WSBS_2016_MAG_OTU3]
MRSKKTTQQITLIALVLGSVLLLAVNLLGQKLNQTLLRTSPTASFTPCRKARAIP